MVLANDIINYQNRPVTVSFNRRKDTNGEIMKKDAYGTPIPDYYNKKLYRSGNASIVNFHLEPRSISMPLVELEHIDNIDMTVYVDEDGWLYLIDNTRTCVYTCTDKQGMNEIVKSYKKWWCDNDN